MLKKLTYKQLNTYLFIIAGALLIVTIFVAIRPAWLMYKENQSMQQRLEQAQQAPARIGLLQKKSAFLNEHFKYVGPERNFRQELLARISGLCEKEDVRLESFKPSLTFTQNELRVETHPFVIQGDFHSLLQVIHPVEKETTLGNLSALHFKRNENRRTGRVYLQATVYIQTIRK